MGADLKKYSLLCYRINHLTQTQKVRFFYALKGRGKTPGIIDQYHIKNLAKGVLLVAESERELTCKFLEFWGCSVRETIVWIEHEIKKKS